MHDQELIKKIKEDNQEAFKTLIDKYKQQVFNIAIGFLHDKTSADDVVQDVFIKFWDTRKNFELTAKFSTWLFRVTSNTCINIVRRNKFSTSFSSLKKKDDENKSLNFEDTIEDENNTNFDEKYRQKHIKSALKIAINKLPKKQRIAFILSKYQDFSYKEIADIMELSVSSIESLLHRAKKNLQKHLLNTYNSLNNL